MVTRTLRPRSASGTAGCCTSGCSTGATTRRSRRSAPGSGCTTSPAGASRTGTRTGARTAPGQSTAATTPGSTRTAATTSSSPPSTPTTYRCPTVWSECSATSTTRIRGRAITSAKLIRPGAVTHVTDTDQRSVALRLKRTAGGITVTVPGNRALVPSGWHMLFVTDAKGTPSEGRWVEVPQGRAVRLLRRPRRAQRVLGPPCARLPGTAPGLRPVAPRAGDGPGRGRRRDPRAAARPPPLPPHPSAPVRTPAGRRDCRTSTSPRCGRRCAAASVPS